MATRNRIRVLLADDHRVVRQGIRGFLTEDPDIEVVAEADDGLEAMVLIEQFCPDVAILDLQMPGQNGLAVTRWIRQQQMPISVLILTAYDDEPYLVAALEAGVNGYVLKCADASELVEAVHTISRGGCVLGSRVGPRVMKFLGLPSATFQNQALSEREVKVLEYAARGLTNKGIAECMEISARTVQGHLARIYDKLDVCNRTEAVMKAAQLNLLSLPEAV